MGQETNSNGQKANESTAPYRSKQDITKSYDNLYFTDAESFPGVLKDWIDKNQNEVITVFDQLGRIYYVSKSVEHLLGYPASALRDMNWYDQIPPEDAAYMRDHSHDLTQSGKTFNIHIKDKQENYIWSECHVAKLEWEGNTYYISILRDISDEIALKKAVIHSEQMSNAGQLAAGIAHEIRNPLTSIKGFIQLLQSGINRREEYYKIIVDEIEKMEAMTSELLFISKPTTDHKQTESVTRMLQDVIQLLKPQARKKNITFAEDLSSNTFTYCNRSQMKQVFINLIKNAIEAMDDGGSIVMSTSNSGNDVIIKISDEGPGFPDEIAHKLGEPFFTTKKSGTGLGLMITKQILKRHNGELQIAENTEKGTTFMIKLTS